MSANLHLVRGVLLLAAVGSLSLGQDRPRLRPVPKDDQGVKTGPAVGAKIPHFEAVDQNGKTQTFESLRGPNGLLLLIVRSADW